ncbi:hypothetical protein [Rhodococcoides corynebacterioides]|uniref:hypothetical protein n=1 Tax=Rhodococcoides corynebacterioides TaxID=53972 RepID=UPI001C9B9274|nr:hypothetical protein [Rhodococcus corynebacterioides]MBY6352030.1 hypothetical protein [Rhodococcus corynebacterioides]
MSRKTFAASTALVVAALFFTACSDDGDSPAAATSGATSAQEDQAAATTPAATESQALVERFTTALDDLGIEHSEPTRTEVGLSGARMVFDVQVNGNDAGINLFPDAETLATWQEASDSFGGIHVALPDGNAVLSLNSSEGIADSAEIAPKIAEAVGGTAHGV